MGRQFDCKHTEDGAFACKRLETDKSGNSRVVGEMIVRANGDCKPIVESSKGEDKAMAELHEHMTKNINYNCTKKE